MLHSALNSQFQLQIWPTSEVSSNDYTSISYVLCMRMEHLLWIMVSIFFDLVCGGFCNLWAYICERLWHFRIRYYLADKILSSGFYKEKAITFIQSGVNFSGILEIYQFTYFFDCDKINFAFLRVVYTEKHTCFCTRSSLF